MNQAQESMEKVSLIKDIKNFLIEANKKGYAAGESAAKPIKEVDGSKTITHENGIWKYHDNYFGGEPYGGREVVFKDSKPVWMMVYYGWVEEGVDHTKVYPFLQEALRSVPEENPYRGPAVLERDNMRYEAVWKEDGDVFSGEEKIFFDNKLVYRAFFNGGLVDQRK